MTTRTYTVTDLVDSVTDPLGRVATATYDPAGRLLSQTDPHGHTTTWTYDRAGREATTTVDGKLITSIDRDLLRRRVVITDYTGPDGLAVDHELGFDRCGRLTSRTRGAQGLSWEYDADGNRTSFTDAHGIRTTYARDAARRITAVVNPLLGDAVFTHDAAGRITSVAAGDLVQKWAYRNGALAEHSRADRAGSGAADVTMIGRDDDGRITGLTRSGVVTRYGYDGAGQMVSASTTRSGEPGDHAEVLGWEYDAGGRLLSEALPGGSRVYDYDAAGQLLSVTEPDGSRTEYVHDGLGRRTRLIGPDGSWTEYAWGPTGLLSGSVVRDRDGAEVSRHLLWVDALGELAAVDRLELWWDTANPVPTLAGIGGGQVLSLPGGVTGVGEAWTASGWRAARLTDQADPWAVVGTQTVADPLPGSVAGAVTGFAGVLPAGITLNGTGGVDIAGLEWLGARAYDPASRGFLSTDPLAPILGAGWDGNPYAYAGNNPLNTTDPTGLRPLTDGELQAYDSSTSGAMAATGEWLGNNWEYLAGGAMVIAGGALMATGVGGPLGMALVGAGVDTIIQKATTGSVNWGQVALTGAVGLVAGPLAGKVSSAVASGLGRAGTALSTHVLPALGRAGSAALSGAGRAGTAVSAVGSRVGSVMASGASRAGSAVASAGTQVGTAVVSGVSRVSSTAGGYVSQLPGQQMLRAAVTNGASGSIGNTGMYFVTNSREEWTPAGMAGAASNGFVSGAVGSQAGYLAEPITQRLESHLVQYAVASGGSIAGGALDHGFTGKEYGFIEMAFDGSAGAVASHFPGASEMAPNPGWMTHSLSAYGGAHVGAIVESVKFVSKEVINQGTGVSPW